MKSGVENMLEVYFKDKKRTKDLELQLEAYNISIDNTIKRIEHIRTNAGTEKRKLERIALFFSYSDTSRFFLLGSNIIEIAKLLKGYKYTGTSFSDAITPSILAQSRSKLRSNGTSKGKQKALFENVSYPDDGKSPSFYKLHLVTYFFFFN